MVSSQACMSMPRSAKINQSYFRFCPILSTDRIFQQRLHRGERVVLGNLTGAKLRIRCEQVATARRAAVAVADRHVAGLVVGHGEREAAEMRLHRIEAGGLGVDRDHAEVARAGDPGVEPVERAHGLVLGTVDRRRARLGGTRSGKRNGGEGGLLRSLTPSPLAGEGWGGGRAKIKLSMTPTRPASPADLPRKGGGEDGEAAGGGGEVIATSCETSLAFGSIALASTPDCSTTRRVSVVNSIALRNAIRFL